MGGALELVIDVGDGAQGDVAEEAAQLRTWLERTPDCRVELKKSEAHDEGAMGIASTLGVLALEIVAKEAFTHLADCIRRFLSTRTRTVTITVRNKEGRTKKLTAEGFSGADMGNLIDSLQGLVNEGLVPGE
jgi:hypothetical protein